MKSQAVTAALSFLISANLAHAEADVDEWKPVQTQERSFTAKYKGDKIQDFAAVFIGLVHVTRYQDGRPSTADHWADDRKCHWTITPTITVQTYAILPDGERAERKDFATVYNPPFTSGGSDFVLSQLRPENCGDTRERFESDINNGVSAVNRDMQSVMDIAFKQVKENMKKKQGVVEVGP